jgi:hypothetical protein
MNMSPPINRIANRSPRLSLRKIVDTTDIISPSLLFFGGDPERLRCGSKATFETAGIRGRSNYRCCACGGAGDAMISVRSSLRILVPRSRRAWGCSWTPRRFPLRGLPVQSSRRPAGFRSQTRPIWFSTCPFSKLVLDAPQQLDTLNIPTAMPRAISHVWRPRGPT